MLAERLIFADEHPITFARMSESPIQNVSDTAFMVAAWRARETERVDALFRDPLAARLAGDHGRRIIENLPRGTFLGGWSVVIRTCIIDEFIRAAVAEGADTILNLGAGLDTRPYRMDLPAKLRWVEVDFPRVIELKETILADETPRCRLERMKLDLSASEERERVLSEIAATSRNVLVLTEGVIPYLDPGEVAALARALRSHASFRQWITDYFSPESYRYRKRKGMTQVMKSAPFRFEPEDFFGFFRDLGWKPRTIRYIPEEAGRLKRPIPLPWFIRLRLQLLKLILPAARLQAMKRFMGYVILEQVIPETPGETGEN
jgi:methyltransferase (TIGR00027 family)